LIAEASPSVFNGIIINQEVIPPNDIDEVIQFELRQGALAELKGMSPGGNP